MNGPTGTRIEHDAFGPVEIPADRYWGAQTQRALGVFEIGDERFPACLVRSFGLPKLAASRANRRLGTLAPASPTPSRRRPGSCGRAASTIISR